MIRLFKSIKTLISGGPSGPAPSNDTPADRSDAERGFIVLPHTGEVIRAERLLRDAGFRVEIKGPPPELRTGCDMVLVFDLLYEVAVRRVLTRERLEPLQIVPVHGGMLEPVTLFQTKDFGDWIMIRAANMKITIEKKTGIIVNISGGGCPDVPYLAMLLQGQCIADAEEPRVKGQTLCAYSLQRAFEEARRIWKP